VRIAVSAGGVLNLGQQPAVTDAFAVKYDSSGSVLYGTYFGGGATVQNAAVLAPNGHLLMAGSTGDGLPVVNPFQAQFGAGATDGFLAELDANGALLSSTYPGGSGIDQSNSALPLGDGSIVLVGNTTSVDFPGLRPSVLDGGSLFVARLRRK
jgi:hypothetical protein